ncbi:MAG: RtcB family protein [Chloroflexota bacterium]|nr:RtcB family protein [Chloroflexota bacterium]
MQLLDNGHIQIPVFGEHDAATLEQIATCARGERVVGAALCADGHKGYALPIGGVVAYEGAVSPNGVGFDIACGLKGTRTDLRADDIRAHIETIMDDIAREVNFGMGGRSNAHADHPLFDDPRWADPLLSGLKSLAREQLGTVGSGNHFVDLLEDEEGWLWVLVHFGSRGFGHKVASGFLCLAAGLCFGDRLPGHLDAGEPVVLPLDTPLGESYFAAMGLAGRYAYAGRDAVTAQVLALLGAAEVDSVHNHHNYAFRETHGGREVIVVRKGSTPAFPGQRGVIGGSMGDVSVVVEGVASDASALAFHSTVHGAGRVMSRTKAAGKRKWLPGPDGRKRPRVVAPGAVSPEMMRAWLEREGVVLRGGGLDESPHVYRRLPEVLAAHVGTIRVVHTLKPLGVAMAGEDVFDPYKD